MWFTATCSDVDVNDLGQGGNQHEILAAVTFDVLNSQMSPKHLFHHQ